MLSPLALLPLSWLAGAGCPPAAYREPRAEIQRLLECLMAADNAGDVEGVVSLYAEEAVLMPPDGPAVQGRAVVRERYRRLFETSRLEVALLSEELHVLGDWAISRGRTSGRVVPKAGGAARSIDDKYLMILRKGPEGKWRIGTLMWSSNDPSRQ